LEMVRFGVGKGAIWGWKMVGNGVGKWTRGVENMVFWGWFWRRETDPDLDLRLETVDSAVLHIEYTGVSIFNTHRGVDL
jgi:hypothetical protein